MKKTMLRSFWIIGTLLFPFVAGAVSTPLIAETSRKSADAANFHEGVIFDAGRAAVYLMNPAGGIDAVSAASGKQLWSSVEAAQPLALIDDILIAQGTPPRRAGVLHLVVLGAEDGKRRQTFTVALPEGIWAAVDDRVGATFRVQAVVLAGEPHVLWDHTRRYTKGIAPQPGEALEQQTVGASRLDLAAGLAIEVDRATLKLEPALPAAVRQATQAWADAGELSMYPAPAGNVIAATRSANEQIVLERWDRQGAPLPVVALFSSPYILTLRSADGQHLLVADRVAPGAWDEYGWSFFDLESGRRLGRVRNHRSHASFFVHDSTLIYVALPYGRRVGGEMTMEAKMLRAVQIGGGKVIWERPLRDTAFRGSFPK